MNNFEERIAWFVHTPNRKSSDTMQKIWEEGLGIIQDLYLALQAKDAEIAELRGLLGEAKDSLACLVSNAERGHYSGEDIADAVRTSDKITAALAGKEQLKC